MNAILPFIIILLIVVGLFMFKNVSINLKAKTHYLIILLYLIMLVLVASYFIFAVNPNLKASDNLSEAELDAWMYEESIYDIIKYDENDNIIVSSFPSEILKETETVEINNDLFKIETQEAFSGLSEWDLVVVIEESQSFSGEVVYERYEAPTILDYEGKYYDITDRLEKITINKTTNGITISKSNMNNIVQINSLTSSLLLTQFKRDEKDWWKTVDSYGYGVTYGPTILRVKVPKNLEIEIPSQLKRFIVEK